MGRDRTMGSYKVVVSDNNIRIENGYLLRGRSFGFILNCIRKSEPNEVTANRSNYSLSCEWAVHNALYKLGLFRSRTKDVDLNYPCRSEWLYILLGSFIYPFAR